MMPANCRSPIVVVNSLSFSSISQSSMATSVAKPGVIEVVPSDHGLVGLRQPDGFGAVIEEDIRGDARSHGGAHQEAGPQGLRRSSVRDDEVALKGRRSGVRDCDPRTVIVVNPTG